MRSDDAGWAGRALSEVEEQVDRTSLQDVQHRVALALVICLAGLVLLLLLVSSLSGSSTMDGASKWWLRDHDLDRLEQILKPGRTITDAEAMEITTMQYRNFLEDRRANSVSRWTRQKTFVGVPLLVVLACAGYLALRCYPSSVFLWGDEVERYNKMIHTRRIVWGIIISLTVVGVLSKLFVMGLFLGP